MRPSSLDLAEAVAVGAGVRHEGAVELLRPGSRLAPLEPPDGVGAAGHVGERVADRLAGRLGVVASAAS